MLSDPTKIPKGQSREVTAEGARNERGVYLHPQTGRKMLVLSVPAADALALQGWTYQGPIPRNHSSVSSQPPKGYVAPAEAGAAEAEALRKQLDEANKRAAEAEEALAEAQKTKDSTDPNGGDEGDK